ncbi:MAG: hypothetical protein M1838_002959 [Thelocarpon superellum]|nr:MAG: hypothetical protein M1838_004787 [Thelocarpon superellum]KAI9842869.1 MAG: hypothetical protein M1838_002959 [Thelocarpon superellum]
MFNRQGKPEEEMFIQNPAAAPVTPTVEPLRISKHGSLSSEHSFASASQPSFPLPPGASSSAVPLPYPDDASSTRRTQSPYQSSQSPHSVSPPPDDDGPDRYASPGPTPGNYDVGTHGADRRKPGSGSGSRTDAVSPDVPDRDGLFAKTPLRAGQAIADDQAADYRLQYFPPPGAASASNATTGGGLAAPRPTTVNRISSTASTSTTKAQRGSPPPPETPILGPGAGGSVADIEARYAAAGIAGTATLSRLQAQNAAATQRANQYAQPGARLGDPGPNATSEVAQRPWTPTELPGSQPFGPPTVYQGSGESGGPNTGQAAAAGTPGAAASPQHLEQDFQRMHVSASPPPAYSSLTLGAQAAAAGRLSEKPGAGAGAGAGVAAGAAAAATATAVATSPPGSTAGQVPGAEHPAFANDPRPETTSPQPGPGAAAAPGPSAAGPSAAATAAGPSEVLPTSPPPLPEGWISHLDPNSGQYYYIHLPTQSTQWEFPKGPTPLNLTEPQSPTLSTHGALGLVSPSLSVYGGKPLASPGMAPMTPGYSESIMSISTGTTAAAGFTGPPPVAGVEMYRVAPTNGVYFGPYLRYTNMDVEHGLWLGSILLVTDAPQPPTIHLHQSADLSPNPRQLKANPIHTHQRWIFYRYDIDLQMLDDAEGTRWTYAITSHLGCTRYEFLVAGRFDTNWRFIAHSGNDFSLGINANERQRLGGVGFMWKDIIQKHVECGGFHAQLGLGDQIYADRLWKEVPLLKQWLVVSGKENRKNAVWTAKHEEDVSHAYFHYYTSHFDQPHLREAFAQIPHVLQIDDHDIFDGFGSYPEYMQFSNMFKNIGRIGIETYLLFQHHTTLEILRNVNSDQDLFSITGTGWHFLKYLGPAVVVVGPDCRSERNPHQVMAGPTYQGIFPKVATLPSTVQHCLWMISVPIIYPRLDAAESVANTLASGKKAVTGAYNVLGKVTSSVAGVVGAKTVVGEGFSAVKKAVGKSGLMNGILSPFGDIDMLDELRDMWTHESKDLERTYLIRTLQGIAHQRNIRMTFLSGAVNCAGAGLVHDPAHPGDHKTMYQIISSAVVSAPPPPYVLKLLQTSNKALYVPANGHRTSNAVSDTKEDMLEVFAQDADGRERESKRLMGRRNYTAFVAYDPEKVNHAGLLGGAGAPGKNQLSLGVNFVVQGEGPYANTAQYGPVVIPCLDFGR